MRFKRRDVMTKLLPLCTAGLVIAAATASGNVGRQQTNRSEEALKGNVEQLWIDAGRLGRQLGVPTEEMKEIILRQPRVGHLQKALTRRGPASFGGMYIDYQPEYRLVILASEGQAGSVAQAVRDLGFADLARFVAVKETPFTEDVLESAKDRIGRAVGDVGLDIDIMKGEVVVFAETLQEIRGGTAISETLGVPANRVRILRTGMAKQHSTGGLGLNGPGGEECTTGFSVKRTTDNTEGVTTAGHCRDGDYVSTLGHHADTPLNYIDGKDGDSQDVQWYRTPNLEDMKRFEVDHSGATMELYSRTDRSEMVINQGVCHYGRNSGGGCGIIVGKSFRPDVGAGQPHHDTFIRTEGKNTSKGDSGGPWYLYTSAYGIHTGATFGSPGIPEYPYFMAQNFMGIFNLQVQIHG